MGIIKNETTTLEIQQQRVTPEWRANMSSALDVFAGELLVIEAPTNEIFDLDGEFAYYAYGRIARFDTSYLVLCQTKATNKCLRVIWTGIWTIAKWYPHKTLNLSKANCTKGYDCPNLNQVLAEMINLDVNVDTKEKIAEMTQNRAKLHFFNWNPSKTYRNCKTARSALFNKLYPNCKCCASKKENVMFQKK